MIPRRRTVLVGEQAILETSIDSAIAGIASVAGDLTFSVAVLDRPNGRRALAVTVGDREHAEPSITEAMARELSAHFPVVTVEERSEAGLAVSARLT